MGRRSRADDPEDVPEARGEQFLSTTDMRGEGSAAAGSTVPEVSGRRTADEPRWPTDARCGWAVALIREDGAEDFPEATGEHDLDDRRRAQRTGGHGPVDGSEEVPNRPLGTPRRPPDGEVDGSWQPRGMVRGTSTAARGDPF